MATKVARAGPSTTRPRAGPSSAPAKTVVKRPTKPATTSKIVDKGDDLAKDLDRVLKLSGPANNAPTKVAPTASRTAKPVNKVASTSRDSRAPFTTGTAPLRPGVGIDKGKKRLEQRSKTITEEPAWATSGLSPTERARGAMGAINEGMKILSAAAQEAQKRPDGSSTPQKGLQRDIRNCELALQGLRELEADGQLGSKGMEIEKAGQGFVSRLLALKETDRAWDQLQIARPILLRQLLPGNESTARQSDDVKDRRLKLLNLPLEAKIANLPEGWRLIIFQSLVHAWAAVLTEGPTSLESVIDIMPFPDTTPPLNHPFHLATALPISSTYPTLALLHRQLLAISTSQLQTWLHARFLAVYLLSLMVSTEADSRVLPGQIWDHAVKCSSTTCEQAKTNPGILQKLAERIGKLVDWVESVAKAKGESLEAWTGYLSWARLTDLWMTIATKAGDVGTIDRVLALQTANLSLRSKASAVPPRTPSSSGSTKTVASRRVGDAEAEITTGIAALAKLDVLLRAYLESRTELDGAAVESGLKSTDLRALSDALLCMPAEDRSTRLLERTCRAVERTRRGTLRLIPTSTDGKGETSLHLAARTWLVDAVDLVEDILSGTLDVSSTGRNLASGSITSLTHLCAYPGPSSAPSLVLLERTHRICDLVKPCSTSSERANLLHCITATAQTVAGQYWRKDKFKEALSFGSASCTWVQEALSLYGATGKADEEDTKAVESLKSSLLKRYELVGACHVKLSNRKAAAETFCQALASPPPKTISHIREASRVEPIRRVFTSADDVSSIIHRLAALVVHDPECIEDLSQALFGKIRSAGLGDDYAGAVGEQMIHLLDERGGPTASEEMGEVMFGLAEATMGLYSEDENPVRRLRVTLRLMSLIGQTGSYSERCEHLAALPYRWSKLENYGEDASLSTFLPGLLATSTLLRALHAYHSMSEPTLAILALAKQAMTELRALILPPTAHSPKKPVPKRPLGRAATIKAAPAPPPTAKSRAASETKVTKAKVTAKAAPLTTSPRKPRSSFTPMIIDDISTFAHLLGSLCSLLGLLGLTLQKVECLKLLRALLRGRAEVADDYLLRSAELGTEYLLLGKTSRASTVFGQAQRYIDDHAVSIHTQCELGLRHSAFLACTGHLEESTQMYETARSREKEIVAPQRASRLELHVDKVQSLERGALARYAAAAMASAKDDITGTILHLSAAFRIRARVGEVACRVASTRLESKMDADDEADDPFTLSQAVQAVHPDSQPPKDEEVKTHSASEHFNTKVLNGLQWRAAEMLFRTTLDWTAALSQRGSVWDAQGLLATAALLASSVKSSIFTSRVCTRQAELLFRRGKYDEAENKLQEAVEACPVVDGPDGVEIKRVRGDILAKIEMVSEARQQFGDASKEVHGLDTVFTAAEALLPSPRKTRLSTSIGSKAMTSSMIKSKEPLLPVALAHVLRRQAWLMRESGDIKSSDHLLSQLDALCSNPEIQSDKHHLDGQIGLLDAFSHFKTDLWMSSLTESTIAMPMGSSKGRMRDRQSTRDSIQVVLEKSQTAYLSALALSAGSGRVEEVRSACLSLALLRAFQTSLGQGSDGVTAAAAEILASTPAITLHRELLESIEYKLQSDLNDLKWPTVFTVELSAPTRRTQASSPTRNEHGTALLLSGKAKEDTDQTYRDYWCAVRDCYTTEGFFKVDQCQVDTLPPDWVVVSINVTDDKNTMFISRHQHDHPPLVFSLPLDRQGRRDGEAEEDLFTFQAARETMKGIIEESNEGARNAKNIHGAEGRAAWWEKRYDLDKQLKELVTNLEFCWLGAFKTILAPRPNLTTAALDAFRDRLDRIFHAAITGPTRTSGARPKVQLDTSLLECFAALGSKCKDEEAEDLVYFILDIYQFHGVPVALAELDIDQIGIDLRSALAELESSRPPSPLPTENLFLALDKNVSGFPWESIPILRGRSVSRVPSLPFLLHQWSLRGFLSKRPEEVQVPGLSHGLASSTASALVPQPGNEIPRITVDSTKVFYILNPSGDLARTQTHFDPWLTAMSTKAGWKGIKGRAPTEMELELALKEYDLVLYFGHGGAEQYIRSHKLCHLCRCATTMLWGCSSGSLMDQGDFDVRGTAWNYMTAGCPSLVATLWDVTDKDIDRLSESVFNKLHLDQTHVRQKTKTSQMEPMLPLSEVSVVEAVAKSRDECKLPFLTGAAPVVYGMPVWMK